MSKAAFTLYISMLYVFEFRHVLNYLYITCKYSNENFRVSFFLQLVYFFIFYIFYLKMYTHIFSRPMNKMLFFRNKSIWNIYLILYLFRRAGKKNAVSRGRNKYFLITFFIFSISFYPQYEYFLTLCMLL